MCFGITRRSILVSAFFLSTAYIAHVYGLGVNTAQTAELVATAKPDNATYPEADLNDEDVGTCPVPIGRDGLRRHHPGFYPSLASEPISYDYRETGLDPWTHIPLCGEDSPFCVFTADNVPATNINTEPRYEGEGVPAPKIQGISIITTPEMAADALHLSHFNFSPEALKRFEERRVEGPPFVIGASREPRAAVPWQHANIKAGETILVERPLVLAHTSTASDAGIQIGYDTLYAFGLGAEEPPRRQMLSNNAVQQLPPDSVDKINNMFLHDFFRKLGNEEDDSQRITRLEAAMHSNSVIVEIAGLEYYGLFPDMSEFNHDCMPNMVREFNEKLMAMVVVAKQDINEGDELTISYIPDGLTFEDRKETLRKDWGIPACACDLCTKTTSDERKMSDQRRGQIRSEIQTFAENLQALDVKKAVSNMETIQSIFIAEGTINSTGADPYGPKGLAYQMAQIYGLAQDNENMVKYLRAALEEAEWRTAGSPNKEERRQMEEMRMIISYDHLLQEEN